ncbi:MAG: hypothetical protein E7Z92_08165, partial [Cyanobacteria bacterium SIG31]|nr:hypothetical protein [Cyanobacteria bacterium SIG31]
RMTTGFKINHAKDNAANYSISTNMSTQLNAYDIAADNVASGMDLVGYANDIISQMQDKAARLNALSTQARNGTYGAQSLAAINSEASALMSEITRLYSTAEYNNISLFDRVSYTIAEHLPQAGESGFIDETALVSMADTDGEVIGTTTEAPKAKKAYSGFIENPKTYTDTEVAKMKRVADVTTFISGEKYSISTAEELQKLANYVNSGKNTTDVEFVLGADIDLSSISNWTPIGDYSTGSSYKFKGIFDGNGHVIKNLKIDREALRQGLFGYTTPTSIIKNIALEGINIKGRKYVGGLVGSSHGIIINCYVTGTITGDEKIGGLAGYAWEEIRNCYATGTVNGNDYVGGLVGGNEYNLTNCYAAVIVIAQKRVGGLIGYSINGDITNCYSTGNVMGEASVGGLIGYSDSNIKNCYSTGKVTGAAGNIGGLVGYQIQGIIENCFSTGTVSGENDVGGLVGESQDNIKNSYSTGNISGVSNIGGLVGKAKICEITNSYTTGSVNGTECVGGLIGYSNYDSSVSNSYTLGNVIAQKRVGGLVGYSGAEITNCYAIGDITGNGSAGGLVGYAEADVKNSYSTSKVTGTAGNIGGLVGYQNSGIITNSYATGTVTGKNDVGGLVGESHDNIENSYATGAVTGKSNIGGLVGISYVESGIRAISDSVSYSIVTGSDSNSTGSFIGGTKLTSNGTVFGTLSITGSQAIKQNMNLIGETYKTDGTAISYDMSAMLAGITTIELRDITTTLQVGIYGNNSCQLNFDTNFELNKKILSGGIETVEAFNAIVAFENLLSEKATQLGAVQNRLESALESIEVNINNLTSSRSTIRDADIAEVSSQYIQQQILQQASATLMATANQMPSIALQLL